MDRKLYKCKAEGCTREVPILSKGRCPLCRHNQRKEEGTLPKYKKSIKPFKKKNKTIRNKERACLGAFFDFHITNLEKNPYSTESQAYISTPSVANIAHLLPKRKQGGFPSIQCNIDNAIYLTIQEHNHFDKLLDEGNFERLEKDFPNSWEEICKKFIKLLNVCKERNKFYFKVEEYLIKKYKV